MFDLKGALKDLSCAFLSIFIGCLIVSPLLIMSGCTQNKYEFSNKIYPKITLMDDENISLEYKLGPLLIFDEIEISKAQMNYLKRLEKENKSDELDMELIVYYDDCGCGDNGFVYYMSGNRLNETATTPIDMDRLVKYEDQLGGFIWKVKDGNEIKDIKERQSPESSNAKPGLKKL
jgi:hypothetical protein